MDASVWSFSNFAKERVISRENGPIMTDRQAAVNSESVEVIANQLDMRRVHDHRIRKG
jgi:hypothetical protein